MFIAMMMLIHRYTKKRVRMRMRITQRRKVMITQKRKIMIMPRRVSSGTRSSPNE
jgi:hypothetical protein